MDLPGATKGRRNMTRNETHATSLPAFQETKFQQICETKSENRMESSTDHYYLNILYYCTIMPNFSGIYLRAFAPFYACALQVDHNFHHQTQFFRDLRPYPPWNFRLHCCRTWNLNGSPKIILWCPDGVIRHTHPQRHSKPKQWKTLKTTFKTSKRWKIMLICKSGTRQLPRLKSRRWKWKYRWWSKQTPHWRLHLSVPRHKTCQIRDRMMVRIQRRSQTWIQYGAKVKMSKLY